jgi:hypothetical protein
MRIFLFVLSALSLLIAAHKFSLAEHTGQHKGGLFFLLIGIQLLITAALISEHRESRTPKSKPPAEKEDSKEAGQSAVNESGEQGKNL